MSGKGAKFTEKFQKREVSASLPDSTILLFGSHARKDNTIKSDYDFLIVTKETIDIHKKRTLKSIIRKEQAKFKISADICYLGDMFISDEVEIL